MVLLVARRVLAGVVVVVLTACLAYGGWRALRHELPQNHPWLERTTSDLSRLLRGDLGEACSFVNGSKSRPCPAVRDLLARGWQTDLWMLAGTLLAGTLAGVAAGLRCALRPRELRTRVLEAAAMLGLCAPPFFAGYGLLILFEPSFGRVKLPLLFDVNVYRPPYEDPWAFVRALLVPWLVAGAPVFAIVMRITRSVVLDTADEDFMRTALAKGLSPRQALLRHGRPLADAAVLSWLGTATALVVFNVLITETVFSVPGFLEHTVKAAKPPPTPGGPPGPDVVLLQAEAVWTAVLVVGLAVLADLAVLVRDPRVRARTRGP